MEKYIAKSDIKELYIKKGEILIIKNGVPCLVKNEERKFPFIDIHNVRFFEPFTEKFKSGDFVKFEKVVYEVVSFDNGQKKYDLCFIGSNKFAFKGVAEKYLEKVEMYYFLSSKGIVQSAVTDKDEEADRWRKLTNNFFLTKQEAKNERIKILNSVTNGEQETN